MTIDLRCYGDEIQRLIDRSTAFDLRSPIDVAIWYREQWLSVADALGFAGEIPAAFANIEGSTEQRIDASNRAGLTAFRSYLGRQAPTISDAHARVIEAVLEQLMRRSASTGDLWRVTADPTTLPSGACYSHDDGSSHRAFYPDTAPGYFGDGREGPPPRAESACGWSTPLVLHLGTWPWVYSTRLDGPPAALRWSSPAGGRPALLGLQSIATLLDPTGNLRQDARQVAAIWKSYSAQLAPALARVPAFEPGRARAGQLYTRGGALAVHQGSVQIAGVMGPRGRVSAAAHNYIVGRFAAFFVLRRAILRALPSMPSLHQIAASSSDPCLRQHAEELARAL
jgi:hypothetical protein